MNQNDCDVVIAKLVLTFIMAFMFQLVCHEIKNHFHHLVLLVCTAKSMVITYLQKTICLYFQITYDLCYVKPGDIGES